VKLTLTFLLANENIMVIYVHVTHTCFITYGGRFSSVKLLPRYWYKLHKLA